MSQPIGADSLFVAGYVPVPVRVTVRSPPPPPFTFTNADLAPIVVGLNVTFIVQVAWPAIDLPQLFVEANCPTAVPVSASALGTAGSAPEEELPPPHKFSVC